MLKVLIETPDKTVQLPELHEGQHPASLTDYTDGTHILIFGIKAGEAFLIVSKQGVSVDSDTMREVISFQPELEQIIERGTKFTRSMKLANGQDAQLILEHI